jgi:transposase-like protein
MSKVDRNNPKRSSASEARCTRFEWDELFPNDAACLDYLVSKLYPEGIFCPKCDRVTKHHRDANRPSFQCQFCGHREHPMVGTIFENSATSLKLWFDAIYLMASTRCGISAKQMERELGVTYKTAWRMFKQIRSMLSQDDDFLSGTVEMDEAYIGPNAKWMHKNDPRRGLRGRGVAGKSKTPVFGMAQRASDGQQGRVVAKVVDGVSEGHLSPHVRKRVLPASVIYTDDWGAYDRLGGEGYQHSRVSHTQNVYVSGDVHTNTIEGFWMLVKSGLRGAYHGVSTKYLQSYLDEYAFRYNNRGATGLGMVGAFLDRIVVKASPETS